jgi:hypothetical protein
VLLAHLEETVMFAANPSHLQPSAPPAPPARPGAGRARIRTRRLAAVITAAAAAVAVWAVAGPLAGIRLQARVGAHAPAQQISLASVLTFSLLAGLAAWALLAVLEHRARHPRRVWTITAASVLAVSLAGPLTAGRGAAAIVALACMHLATGGVLIPALRRSAPVTRAPRNAASQATVSGVAGGAEQPAEL